MSTWLDPIQHRLCSRSRCQLPIAGVGEAYGLCDGHGHEERNRRLAERDAKARAVTQRPIVRGLTVTPKDRPLSAIVGARPTPPPIQPSAATVAAKEPPVPKPLVLKPNADALPPTVCRIAGCDAKGHARGLCSPHYAAARANRSIEALALPSTQTKRPPKPVEDQRITTEAGLLAALGTLPPPARGIVERLCTEAPKLRQDLADAVARSEAAEKAKAELEQAEGDLLEESIEVAKVLCIDTSGDYDLTARAREVMNILEFVRSERDAADAKLERVRVQICAELDRVLAQICAEIGIDQDGGGDWVLAQLHDRLKGDADEIASANKVADLLRSERAEMLPWHNAALECAAALGASTPDALLDAVRALIPQPGTVALDQPAQPAMVSIQADLLPPWLGAYAQHEAKPHRVAQAGGHDLGVLVGYIDQTGLFRVTEGPKKGAVYGCLYRAEPIERPVLGEPTPDRDVWVRTSIDEVTAHNIHTADGGRFRRSEWGPARFAPVAKSTTSSAAVGDDDLPF